MNAWKVVLIRVCWALKGILTVCLCTCVIVHEQAHTCGWKVIASPCIHPFRGLIEQEEQQLQRLHVSRVVKLLIGCWVFLWFLRVLFRGLRLSLNLHFANFVSFTSFLVSLYWWDGPFAASPAGKH